MSASAAPFAFTDIAERILVSAIILGITYALGYVFTRAVMRAIGRRNRSSAYEIGRVGSIVIWLVGIVSILPVIGASDIVVAVVILLVGAFLIIATRDFSSNWFAGQMLKTLAPFRVGDWIKTSDGSYGRVTRIEGLYTMLVTPQNETVVIPNSKLTSDL
ncbi:MAG: mechanosensitive ion channel family protein, partial [archaeon]|nr:mechanosensitive ion channel family protein [archaeon]